MRNLDAPLTLSPTLPPQGGGSFTPISLEGRGAGGEGEGACAQAKPLLIFSYGNPSRGDDALGPLLIERLAERNLPHADLLTDFQLQVEHALDLDGRELVLFVDASVSCPSPFQVTRLEPAQDLTYTTHAMSPAAILHVYREIRGCKPPPCFLLAIRGERFELGEGLSPAAQAHLSAALALVEGLCADPAGWAASVNC